MNYKNQTNNYTDFFYYTFRNILIFILPLTIISALMLSSFHSSALPVDSVTLSLPTSCSLSSVVNTPHNATMVGGTYLSNIGKTTIKTLCNDGNGYAIYANGFSNNVEGNNVLVSSINNNHNIATGLATNGETSNWAMRLDSIATDGSTTPPIIEQAYNSTYGLVPNTWTKVAGRTSGTTDMVKGSSFAATYSVYTAPTQHAGTYNGQIKYALIHTEGDESISGIRFMQNVAEWKDELVLEESVQVIDIRDGKTYYVTKLKDGNIWMTQNLDFDLNSNNMLNSNTTDLNVIYDPSTGDYPEYNDGYDMANGVIYWEPASTATRIGFQNTGPVTGWQDSNTEPYSASKIDSAETGHASLGNYYNWTAAVASNNSSSLTQDTLNNIANNPKNSICPKGWRLPTISNQSAGDIDSTNEFARLNYLYNNNLNNTNAGLIIAPLWFVSTGVIRAQDNTVEMAQYTYGYYSSSTYSNSIISMYNFQFSADSVSTAARWSTGNRRAGFAIRCVAR